MKNVDMEAPFINLDTRMEYDSDLDMMTLCDDEGHIVLTKPVAEKSTVYDPDAKRTYKRVGGEWEEIPIECVTMRILDGYDGGGISFAEDEEDL